MAKQAQNIRYTFAPEEQDKSLYFDYVYIVPEHQIELHEQQSWELSYIITGRGTRVIGDTMQAFAEGEVVLVPPNIPHCWSFDPSVHDKHGKIENITITFSDNLLTSCPLVFPELVTVCRKIQDKCDAVSFTDDVLAKLQKLLKMMIPESEPERLSRFFSVLSLIASDESGSNVVGRLAIEDKKNKRIQSIYLYVMNNYQKDITLDSIAQFAGMERASFCVFFKKMTGKSFFTFLTDYRVEASCQMLQKTNKSIAEICLASGFRDVPYYNRVFKKAKQVSPSEYRRVNLSHSFDIQ